MEFERFYAIIKEKCPFSLEAKGVFVYYEDEDIEKEIKELYQKLDRPDLNEHEARSYARVFWKGYNLGEYMEIKERANSPPEDDWVRKCGKR